MIATAFNIRYYLAEEVSFGDDLWLSIADVRAMTKTATSTITPRSNLTINC
jgi:hypothetical protein